LKQHPQTPLRTPLRTPKKLTPFGVSGRVPRTDPPTPTPDPGPDPPDPGPDRVRTRQTRVRTGSDPSRPGSGPGPDRVREGVWGAKLGSKKFDLDRPLQDPKTDPKKSRLEPPKKCSKKCLHFSGIGTPNLRSGPKHPVTLGSKTAHCDSAGVLAPVFQHFASANSQTWTRVPPFKGPVLGCVLDTF
jgi:hypothetical protein